MIKFILLEGKLYNINYIKSIEKGHERIFTTTISYDPVKIFGFEVSGARTTSAEFVCDSDFYTVTIADVEHDIVIYQYKQEEDYERLTYYLESNGLSF